MFRDNIDRSHASTPHTLHSLRGRTDGQFTGRSTVALYERKTQENALTEKIISQSKIKRLRQFNMIDFSESFSCTLPITPVY